MYQAQSVKKQCNFCGREGLLIYPTRYAVACPAGAAGIPGLSGNFNIGDAPSDISPAKYTLRSLRPGYLYSYDEKRRRLKAYVVTPKGFLSNFPLRYLAPGLAKATFRCTDPGEIMVAHCVDIAHTPRDPAGNLWLGWSSVMWTQALIDKIGDAAWRKLHMQCIDVGAMLAGSAAHTGGFEEAHKNIAHFAAGEAAMKQAFDFSNTPTENEIYMHGWSQRMQQMMATRAPHHQGYVVAVNDPVGITNDLSELTVPSLHNGFDEDAYRGKMVHDMLEAAEHCVRAAAREDVLFRDTLEKNSQATPDGDPVNAAIKLWEVIKAGGPAKLEQKRDKDRQIYGEQQEGRQQAAADHAWEDVISEEIEAPPQAPSKSSRKRLLDQARLDAFPDVYANALDKFTPKYERHAGVHLNWMKSEQLANWMAGVHDPADIRSGYAYSESMTQCIGKAASSASCVDQLTNWLSRGALSDIRNLYGRALMFNQTDLIDATEANLKGSDLKFKLLLTLYANSLKRINNGDAARLIDRLALATANVLVKALRQNTFSTMQKVSLSHFALIGGDILLPGNATYDDIVIFLRENFKWEDSVVKVSKKQFDMAINMSARDAIKKNPPNPGLLGWGFNMKKLQDEGILAPKTIRGAQIPGFRITQQWLGSGVPTEFHRGVVTTIVQMAALGFASENLAKSDHFNTEEMRLKTAMAVVSLCSSIVETTGQILIKNSSHPLSAYLIDHWAIHPKYGTKIVKLARLAGGMAGLVVGIYDITLGIKDYQNGQYLLGKLKVTYGILGCAVAVAGYYAFALFWPLLIMTFVLGIIVSLVANGALRKWVSHCYFSQEATAMRITHEEANSRWIYPYPTIKEELMAFNNAVGVQYG